MSVVAQHRGHEAEIEQARVLRVVIVVLGLDAGVLDALDRALAGKVRGDRVGDLADRHLLGELVEDPILAGGRPGSRQLMPDALDGIDEVDETARLASGAVHRERMAEHGLDTHAVQHGAEHAVVVKPRGEPRIEFVVSVSTP